MCIRDRAKAQHHGDHKAVEDLDPLGAVDAGQASVQRDGEMCIRDRQGAVRVAAGLVLLLCALGTEPAAAGAEVEVLADARRTGRSLEALAHLRLAHALSLIHI